MQPLFGFIIFAILVIVISIIATKKNGPLQGVIYFVATCLAGFILVVIASRITNGNGIASGLCGFLAPLMALIIVTLSSDSERKATVNGEHGEYRKCPFCAEAVRKEAVKCKHCGSDISGTPVSHPPQQFKPADMPFDRFFSRQNGDLILNEASVDELVDTLRKNNPNDSLTEINQKNKASIDKLVNQFPSKIREDFLRYYTAKM